MLKRVSANKMWEQTRRLRFTENVVIISLQHFQQIKKANVLGVGGRVLAAGEVCGGRALCKNALGRTQAAAASPSCFLLAPRQPHKWRKFMGLLWSQPHHRPRLIPSVKLVAPPRKMYLRKVKTVPRNGETKKKNKSECRNQSYNTKVRKEGRRFSRCQSQGFS